jgi:hypothetical protein
MKPFGEARPPVTENGSEPKRRSWARGDLRPVTRPPLQARWHDAQALEQLRDWAQARAEETIHWYLRDKQPKRWASRLLRGGAVLFAVTGGVLPLLTATATGINPSLGYVFLALAAGCVAFDHFFGLSAGWIRDIVALQSLQGSLTRFHLDWARWQAACAAGTGSTDSITADSVVAGLELIGGLIDDLTRVTEAETAQWVSEFSSSVAALRQQANPGVASPADLISWSSHPIPPAG